MQQLQPGATLQGGKYKIERVLGQGGFGITYLALNTMLDGKVAIKEFFLKEFCDRAESTSAVTFGSTGGQELTSKMRDKFVKEARNLAKLKHPNIVKVIDIFEENNTAYYIMEYCEGGSLADKVKQQGYLSEPLATRYILQVASALGYLHERQMNHLDVKPANIMLNEDDEAVLIDFGLSKQYDNSGNQTSTTPVGISEGYAPMEQYMQGGVQEFSPETDIYALGATYYKLLTGVTPPNASFVNNEGLPVIELKAKGVSENAIAVICQAMESRKKDRTKDTRTFIDGLNAQNVAPKQAIIEKTEDDEATVLTPKIQQTEEELIRKEVEIKAVAEQKAREDVIRKQPETKQKPQVTNSSKKWIAFAIGALAIAGIAILGLNNMETETQPYEEPKPAAEEPVELPMKGTQEAPTDADFSSWYVGKAQVKGMPRNVSTLTTLDDVQGGWKALFFQDPKNKYGVKAYTLANVIIAGADSDLTVSIKRHNTYFFTTNEKIDQEEELDDVFKAEWMGGKLYTIGAGSISSVTISSFWEQDGKQYAIGTFDSHDGLPVSLGMVRP